MFLKNRFKNRSGTGSDTSSKAPFKPVSNRFGHNPHWLILSMQMHKTAWKKIKNWLRSSVSKISYAFSYAFLMHFFLCIFLCIFFTKNAHFGHTGSLSFFNIFRCGFLHINNRNGKSFANWVSEHNPKKPVQKPVWDRFGHQLQTGFKPVWP
jgi:hypothetical protein